VLGAESRDDTSRRADAQLGAFMFDSRVQRDQPSQQRWPQQAATGQRIGLPIDEHLTAPQAGAGLLVVAAEIGRQLGVRVSQGSLDTVQARGYVGHRCQC